MVNKITTQTLRDRLPLALVSIPPNVIEMVEWKWGMEDNLFHSTKATIKKFPKFKSEEIKVCENKVIDVINDVLINIYNCPNCGTDLRKCGVHRRSVGIEMVELYISEDGVQARTSHERFERNGSILYTCISCNEQVNSKSATFDFLIKGIKRNTCIEYMHKYYPDLSKKIKINDETPWGEFYQPNDHTHAIREANSLGENSFG